MYAKFLAFILVLVCSSTSFAWDRWYPGKFLLARNQHVGFSRGCDNAQPVASGFSYGLSQACAAPSCTCGTNCPCATPVVNTVPVYNYNTGPGTLSGKPLVLPLNNFRGQFNESCPNGTCPLRK